MAFCTQVRMRPECAVSRMALTNLAPDREALAAHLRQHPYFQQLDAGRLDSLASQATCHLFEAGEIILLDGAACGGLWVIGRGQVKVYKLSQDGNEHILHLLGPGESFNDIAGLDGGPNPASAAALSNMMACCLSHETLIDAVLQDPQLAVTLIQFLTQRTRTLVQQIEDLALYSVRTRVARFLLKQATNPTLSSPVITRSAIAAHLGTQPETISRALKSLEKAGVIEVDRTDIRVLRDDLLRAAAMT